MRRFAWILGFVLVGCQTLIEEFPTAPDSVASSGSNVPAADIVVTPVALPSPTSGGGSSDPAPSAGTPSTPASDPTPAPPSAPVQSAGCSLPRGTGSGQNCPRLSPQYLSEVEAAIDLVVKQRPDCFNLNDSGNCGNCYKIRDNGCYESGVVAALESFGLCATFDGEEFGVKGTNSFNEQYDLTTSDFHIRRQLGSYRSTCQPAWF